MKKNNIDLAAKRYLEIKKTIKTLETEADTLKQQIELNGEGETENYIIQIIISDRESFSLKRALNYLDKRVLSPFITKYECKTIKIKERK